MHKNDKPFFLAALILLQGSDMDKATKRQFSIGFFVIGFVLIAIQDLKRLDSINLGFTWPFAIMFYLGLVFMAIGYYLK